MVPVVFRHCRRNPGQKVVLVPIPMAMVPIPMVLLCFSYGFPMVFLWHPGPKLVVDPIHMAMVPILRISFGFPMEFRYFPYGSYGTPAKK